MQRVHHLRRVADDQPAVAEQLRHRPVAALGDQMGGVLLDLAAVEKLADRRVLLEPLEQAVRRHAGVDEIGDEAADADRQRLLVGVDEAGAEHAFGHRAGGLDDDALLAGDVEALLEHLGRQEVRLLHRQRHVVRLDLVAKTRPLRHQRVHPVGEDDDVGMDLAAVAVGLHSDDAAGGVAEQVDDRSLADHQGAGLLHRRREPLVERRPQDGVTVRPLLVEVLGAVVGADVGALVQHPHPLLDDVPLQRRLVAELGDHLLDRVGVEDGALHVLRAGVFAALDLQDVDPAAGERQRRGVAGGSAADDDGFETFGHGVSLLLVRRRGPRRRCDGGRPRSAPAAFPAHRR